MTGHTSTLHRNYTVCIFVNYLNTKLHVSSSNISLIILALYHHQTES
jgi:hypothetical protein